MIGEFDFASLPDVRALRQDIHAFHETLTRNNAVYTAIEAQATPPARAHYRVGVDLFLRMKEYGQAAAMLLGEGSLVAFAPVHRALFEAVLPLRYLTTHSNPEFEAQVAIAHGYRRALNEWVDRGRPLEGRARAKRLANRLQALALDRAAIDEAQARAAKCRSWTGLSMTKLVNEFGGPLTTFADYYSPLSRVSHPDGILGGALREPPPEAIGRWARQTRALMRDGWSRLKTIIPIPLPDAWLDDPTSASGPD